MERGRVCGVGRQRCACRHLVRAAVGIDVSPVEARDDQVAAQNVTIKVLGEGCNVRHRVSAFAGRIAGRMLLHQPRGCSSNVLLGSWAVHMLPNAREAWARQEGFRDLP